MARVSSCQYSSCPRLPTGPSGTAACPKITRYSVKQRFSRHSAACQQPAAADASAAEAPQQQQQQEEAWDYVAPDHVLERNRQ